MNHNRAQIPRESLLRVLKAAQRHDQAMAIALGAVEGAQTTKYAVATVDKSELVSIYSRRLSRKGFLPLGIFGAERLLGDLIAYPKSSFEAVTLEHEGRVTTVWFDAVEERLVGIISGLDQRASGD